MRLRSTRMVPRSILSISGMMRHFLNTMFDGLSRLFRSEADEQLIKLVRNGWRTARVVGRGTIKIDPAEVYASSEYKEAVKRAEEIVKRPRVKDSE